MESARSDGAGPPERLGRYELVTEIGSGPLGALHAAYVSSGAEEGRIVALRRLPISVADRDAQQRVSRAGIAAMSMRHPRLTAVLDVVPRPDEIVVVSEYVEAASLRSVLAQAIRQHAPLPAGVAVAIAMDVLRALRAARDLWRELSNGEHAPAAELIHGGLLPDSVLIASFGESMLADVGIAGAASRAQALSSHPDALAYRAPEQRAGTIDERADVFAVGALLWEMLANRRLPPSGAIARLDRIERPGARLAPMLVEIVREAVAGPAAQRFPSLDAVLDAIRTLARDAIASPEQVAVALGRLVRPELDARRITIERAHGFDRVSALPESGRATARPPAPDAFVRVTTSAATFSVTEAPTVRRRSTPKPNTVPAIDVTDSASPETATDPPREDVTGSGIRARSRDSVEPSGIALVPPLASGDERVRRRRTLALVAGVAALVALAILLARTLGGAASTSPSTAAQPSARAKPRASAEGAAQSETRATPPPESTEEPAVESLDEPAERAPAPAKPERRPERTHEPAPAGRRPFRPRGI